MKERELCECELCGDLVKGLSVGGLCPICIAEMQEQLG